MTRRGMFYKTKLGLPIGIILVVLAMAAAILVLVMLQGLDVRRQASGRMIVEAARAAREKFLEVVAPIEKNLVVIRKWGESGLLDISKPIDLDRKFLPLLESQPMISGLLVADTNGREYFLYRESGSWLTHNAGNYQPDGQTVVQRLTLQGALLKTWEEKRDYDPRTRTWFSGVMQKVDTGDVIWTKPYRFFTAGQVGLTAAVGWRAGGTDDLIYVAAFDVLLGDLYGFLSRLEVSPGAMVLFIGADGKVISDREETQASRDHGNSKVSFVEPAELTDPVARDAMGLWDTGKSVENESLEFISGGKKYWAGFQSIQPDNGGAWIAVVIPEEDLVGDFTRIRLNNVLIGLAILACGGLMILYLIRRHRAGYQERGISNGPGDDFETILKNLITDGESSRLEFKSTIRTNLKSGEKDKAIEVAWLKTVAAFMNSEGGVLVIGVEDDGHIMGVEADGFANHDLCGQHLKNLINQHIGPEFSPYVQMAIKTVHDRTVVLLTIERTALPVFLVMGKDEAFYIRSGPSSVKLPMSKMVKYLEQRN